MAGGCFLLFEVVERNLVGRETVLRSVRPDGCASLRDRMAGLEPAALFPAVERRARIARFRWLLRRTALQVLLPDLFELVPLQALCGMAGPIEVEELRRRTFERGEHARLTADLDARQTTVLDESLDQTLEVIGAVVDAGWTLAVGGQPREQLAQQRLEAGRQVVGVSGSFGFVVAVMLHSYLLAPWATACVLTLPRLVEPA